MRVIESATAAGDAREFARSHQLGRVPINFGSQIKSYAHVIAVSEPDPNTARHDPYRHNEAPAGRVPGSIRGRAGYARVPYREYTA